CDGPSQPCTGGGLLHRRLRQALRGPFRNRDRRVQPAAAFRCRVASHCAYGEGGEVSVREKLELSIIVPVFNEEDNVAPLCQAISSALDALGLPYEVLLVDDGSRDRTFDVAVDCIDRHPRLRVIRL